MISDSNIPNLSKSCQESYSIVNATILRIFALVKSNGSCGNLKEDFHDKYIDFARKLDNDGYRKESNSYMTICLMYCDLMDRPEEFIAHESFFMDLFNAFDELLCIKINKPDEYDEKYRQYMLYKGKMEEYYYSNLTIPSKYYDEEKLNSLIYHLGRAFDN